MDICFVMMMVLQKISNVFSVSYCQWLIKAQYNLGGSFQFAVYQIKLSP
ncbi:hypothetical protein IMCC21906_01224 [Spongiibacter sp. IMCC21906]|jgi:hypothetical protein|nr:hypothetical protein [Spongiibacter sp. IMCC21906]AKH68902.1 hypothetical protein IMCC21906_01224 [Spongiibacter sp. IMCC21906]